MMTDAIASAQSLIALGAICGTLFILHGPWQSLWTDWARQAVFERRDAIFDLAAAGKLDFNSREYQAIRASFHGMIKFAHELTLPAFAVTYFAAVRRGLLGRKSAARVAIEHIADEDTRKRVEVHVNRAGLAILISMLAKSPLVLLVFLIPLLLAVVLVLLLERCRESVKAIALRTADLIQREAETEGRETKPLAA